MLSSPTLLLGDCLLTLKSIADNSIDSVVTDPPYGLSFMGKTWDYQVPTTEIWKECLRVLKPGGHLLAFGGTRTYHRLVVNIEDAGFEIRDQIMWIYGSGFPKSMDISKAIDKEAGAERTESKPNPHFIPGREKGLKESGVGTELSSGLKAQPESLSLPATDDAKKWSGYGTALKPANEPICLARKPLSEKTVAKNVLKHGVGGLNVDASRIETTDNLNGGAYSGADRASKDGTIMKIRGEVGEFEQPTGRFPANILFDEAAAAVLDEQSGFSKSSVRKLNGDEIKAPKNAFGDYGKRTEGGVNDSGGASRFFYVAKASKKDRGEGNTHPTVKPIKLMEYLVKLVTPEGGVVLDPFMGSGTTGVAALNNGFAFVGCEMTPEYLDIAISRIKLI
ncbi:MAG: site-specific DNA-methyltransferase [Proteobacteria bacterium]|nr:MAG: site-specific DNA-methyltransferase [Pseudomonadota bacterium]